GRNGREPPRQVPAHRQGRRRPVRGLIAAEGGSGVARRGDEGNGRADGRLHGRRLEDRRPRRVSPPGDDARRAGNVADAVRPGRLAGRRTAESVRRRDRLRTPTRGHRRASRGATGVRPARAQGPLRPDRALHRHGDGRRRALGEPPVSDPVTQFKLNSIDTRLGPLALVTIDNGEDYTKPTLLSRSAMESLAQLLPELESGGWTAMVLTGKPFVFAAGADMKEFPKIRTREEASFGSRAGHELFARLAALPYPTVAAINGACLGGGVEIALHCTARTISSSVRHFACPEVFLGIFPAWGGTQLVPPLVGVENAIKFVVANPLKQNRMLDGAKAFEQGFADRLLEPVEFVDESIAFALELAGGLRPERTPPEADLEKALRKGRAQADDSVHGAAP